MIPVMQWLGDLHNPIVLNVAALTHLRIPKNVIGRNRQFTDSAGNLEPYASKAADVTPDYTVGNVTQFIDDGQAIIINRKCQDICMKNCSHLTYTDKQNQQHKGYDAWRAQCIDMGKTEDDMALFVNKRDPSG